MNGLTARQREVLVFIAACIRDSGYPPTIREIGAGLRIKSTNGVNDHLKALDRKGYIERDTSKSRAIQLTSFAEEELGLVSEEATASGVSVPVLGGIAAGLPLESVSSGDEHVVVDPSWLGRSEGDGVFALRVSGESMIEDGIFDGDLIFVKQQPDALRGEMVAVWVDGGATVKRYYREGEAIRLEPSNASMAPIYIRPGEVQEVSVLGRVVGVYRQLD